MFEKISSLWSSSSSSPSSGQTPSGTGAAKSCASSDSCSRPAAIDPTDPKQNPLNPKGLKPCCACPETKRVRDNCFLGSDPSEADEQCRQAVAAHIACMRGYGFKV